MGHTHPQAWACLWCWLGKRSAPLAEGCVGGDHCHVVGWGGVKTSYGITGPCVARLAWEEEQERPARDGERHDCGALRCDSVVGNEAKDVACS
ncbi:hypothetical protein NDU88_004404 [Pleurodeles waltl]|uniref:Secreted protein n=1 Tax=Pleurodeles waltl TaxID=8319 RepID=A0AAV7UI38_PLEWA|nr:hypothetical protein NDU88_004404 [Pleurodeles waltl]